MSCMCRGEGNKNTTGMWKRSINLMGSLLVQGDQCCSNRHMLLLVAATAQCESSASAQEGGQVGSAFTVTGCVVVHHTAVQHLLPSI
jgi:hypothetical protein